MTSRRFQFVSIVVIASTWCLTLATPVEAATSCADLNGKVIAPSAIGLPTTGARVLSTAMVQTPGPTASEYCKVLGVVSPVDRAAPEINFQVNLPAKWNGKAVQYGGGVSMAR